MVTKKLEYQLEKRIDGVTEKCDKFCDRLYLDLMENIHLIASNKIRNRKKKMNEIEIMFLKITRNYVEISYKIGVNDGLLIRNQIS
jgi:hypothetical protein